MQSFSIPSSPPILRSKIEINALLKLPAEQLATLGLSHTMLRAELAQRGESIAASNLRVGSTPPPFPKVVEYFDNGRAYRRAQPRA